MRATPKETARVAWAEAMEAMIEFLYRHRTKEPKLAANLTQLELPNLLLTLEHLRGRAAAERVVSLATRLESLIAPLGRARTLARVVDIRAHEARRLGGRSHAQYLAERAAIERSIDRGRYGEAADLGRSLLAAMNTSGDDAYLEAPYDIAMAYWTLGRALQMSGAAEEALKHLEEAGKRFRKLGADRMANVVLTLQADCLSDLGRYDEAADLYEESIRIGQEADDLRSVAVNKGQLATLRAAQRRYPDALKLHAAVRDVFEQLGEPSSVATAWQQIGNVYLDCGQYNAAERAYQDSLRIEVQVGNRAGEAMTLGALGNLYSKIERPEEAVLFYRRAAEAFVEVGDLRFESVTRYNIADELVRLTRYDEARKELLRAIECEQPFGHVAAPWKMFSALSNLERAVGDQPAALKARDQAVQAYLAYRRDGGESQTTGAQLCAAIALDPDAARGRLAELRQEPDVPAWLTALLPLLEAVLDGSRDPALADDPNLNYADAAELLLLIEALALRDAASA
jgi:tetratricopeptide (TPR) repeat protein